MNKNKKERIDIMSSNISPLYQESPTVYKQLEANVQNPDRLPSGEQIAKVTLATMVVGALATGVVLNKSALTNPSDEAVDHTDAMTRAYDYMKTGDTIRQSNVGTSISNPESAVEFIVLDKR